MHFLRMVLLGPLQQMINAERGNESNAMVDGEGTPGTHTHWLMICWCNRLQSD